MSQLSTSIWFITSCDIGCTWMYCAVLWTDIYSLHDTVWLHITDVTFTRSSKTISTTCTADWSLQCSFQARVSDAWNPHYAQIVSDVHATSLWVPCVSCRLLISVRMGTTMGRWWLQHTSWLIPTADGMSLQVPLYLVAWLKDLQMIREGVRQ